MDHTTLATIPRLIAQILPIYDVDPQIIFTDADINLEDVKDSKSRITMDKMTRLWQLSAEATGNTELGLVAASFFQPSYIKGLGFAWMASANLEEGLRLFVKNGQMLNTALKIELVESDDELLIKPQAIVSIGQQKKAHPCAIQLGMAFFPKMFSLVASKNIPATKVYFNFAIQDSLKAYEDYFQCPVVENSSFVGISFSKKLLKEALPTHDPELVELNAMTVKKYISEMNNGEISNKVIKVITELLPSGCPSEEVIAHKLFMSKRTLQRKLNKEGQLYSTLLNSVRLALAKQHLSMTKMPITEIAYQLGYSSPSTFARAFKKQLELSPVEYRTANI